MYHSAAPKSPIILIPTRLAAARLPRKPLADIAGAPMILHVWRHAVAAEVGPVVVASGDREIADIVEREGGRSRENAEDYVRNLAAGHRYQRDVY